MLPFIAKTGSQSDVQRDAAMRLAKDKGYDNVVKALEHSDYAAAGVLVPDQQADDFIEALYANNVVRSLGAQTLDISGGEINIGKQNSKSTAYWVGEASRITPSEGSYGEKKLSPHKLAVLVPISNELLDRLPAGMEEMIRNDMLAVAQNALDLAYIRGAGSSNTPQGILNQTASGNKFNATDGPTVAQVARDLIQCMYLVEKADIPMTTPGWMFHPRIKNYLMSLRTDDGFPIYQQELANGNLFGHAYGTTTQIPIDKTGDGDETEIYFGDFSQVVVGTSGSVQVSESDTASFVQSGSTVHGFQDDVSVIKLTTHTDLVQRHDEAFGIIENADWGKALDS
jgi:HK97 family phage major capsid protein